MLFDKEMKDKEIKYKLERINNLEREYEILNAMKAERIKEEINLKQLRQKSVTNDIRKQQKNNEEIRDNRGEINTNYEMRIENDSQCAVCDCLII